MRNNTVKMSKKVAAIILSATLGLSLLAGCGTTTSSADKNTTKETTDETATEAITPAENMKSGNGNATKSETVYVTADGNGNVSSITVSDWLKNTENYEKIDDTTNMKDIVVIKGSDDYSQNGEDLSFNSLGNDVYYRGEVSNKEDLPVSMEITYTLDGKTITPEQLDGATGHLETHVKYKNNSTYSATIDGKKKDIHVPFLATTMIMVDSSSVKNAEIDHGKIVENGDLDVIVGYGLPGLNESFGINDGGVFTDEITFSADVTNYSQDAMLTYVTCEPFAASDLDEAVDLDTVSSSLEKVTDINVKGVGNLNDIHDLDDLQDVLDEVKDAFHELNDGTSQLKDGSKELKDGADQLNEGMTTFNSKMALFNDKLASAKDGGATLSKNMKTAATSSTQLASGASQVSAGLNQLSTALTGMYATISSTIQQNEAAMQKLQAGLKAAPAGSETYMTYFAQYNQLAGANAALKQIKASMDQANLAKSLQALNAGAKQVSDGSAALSAGLGKLSTGANTLSSGLVQLSSGSNQLFAASGQLHNGTGKLSDGAGKLFDGATKLYDGTSSLADGFSGNLTPLLDTAKALKDAAISYNTFTTLKEGTEGNVSFVIKTEQYLFHFTSESPRQVSLT